MTTSPFSTSAVLPRALHISLWALQALLAAAFLAAGGAKLAGVPVMVAMFEQIGIGQWFRYATGAVEVAGAIALIVPRTAAHAAALLALTMLCAVATHLALIGGSALPAVLLGGLCATVAWGRWPR